MSYFDQEKNLRYIPYVIEPSLGRGQGMVLAFLVDAYDEEMVDEEKGDMRTVLRLHPALAPIKCAVLPLSKKLSEPAFELYRSLQKCFMVDYDESGSIGKRYRRQDEIGTPFCVTYDFESENDGCVTVRHRDSMEQERTITFSRMERAERISIFWLRFKFFSARTRIIFSIKWL
jgi:glycyl-tRNA synthetase